MEYLEFRINLWKSRDFTGGERQPSINIEINPAVRG